MVERPAVDTRVVPFVVVGDLAAFECSTLLGCTTAAMEPLESECTMLLVQTAVVVQPVSVVATE